MSSRPYPWTPAEDEAFLKRHHEKLAAELTAAAKAAKPVNEPPPDKWAARKKNKEERDALRSNARAASRCSSCGDRTVYGTDIDRERAALCAPCFRPVKARQSRHQGPYYLELMTRNFLRNAEKRAVEKAVAQGTDCAALVKSLPPTVHCQTCKLNQRPCLQQRGEHVGAFCYRCKRWITWFKRKKLPLTTGPAGPDRASGSSGGGAPRPTSGPNPPNDARK